MSIYFGGAQGPTGPAGAEESAPVTFTPSLVVSAGVVDYVRQEGYAIKTGRLVHVWGQIIVDASSPGTFASMQIEGLPYPINFQGLYVRPLVKVQLSSSSGTVTGNQTGFFGEQDDRLRIYEQNGTTYNNITQTFFHAGGTSTIEFDGFYLTDEA